MSKAAFGSPSRLTNLATSSQQSIESFIKSIDTVLVDTSGVLWISSSLVDHSEEALSTLRQLGKRIFFITNHFTMTRDDFMAKAHVLGFECAKEEVLTTSYLTADFLAEMRFEKKVYLIGSEGLAQELEEVGIRHTGSGPDHFEASGLCFKNDPSIGAVVVGLDQYLSYPKFVKGCSYLSNPNVLFIATDDEENIPYDGNIEVPGTGCIVKPLEKCSKRSPIIIGKPSTYVRDFLAKRYRLEPKKTLVIGDGCNTDILLGTKCGFQTLLVLTGVTKLEDVAGYQSSRSKEDLALVPDFYINSIGDLVDILNK